jgi:predicted GIY-YIG superfamily endonuclease
MTEVYSVYKIIVAGKVRYVGYTNNVKRRELEHNNLCFSVKKRKEFYNKLRQFHPEIKEIKLEVCKRFKSKVKAKRYECLLILFDYFKEQELWQRVPRITDK